MKYDATYLTGVTSMSGVANAAVTAGKKRRIRQDITLGAGGTATVTFSQTPAFALPPMVDPIVTTNTAGTIQYTPKVTSVSATSITVSGVRTKGTLLLTAGPVEVCQSGDVVSVWLIEQ